MASRLEALPDQAEQMLSELDFSQEEGETILEDLHGLEEEYHENVSGCH
jgi:hypothetical protein